MFAATTDRPPGGRLSTSAARGLAIAALGLVAAANASAAAMNGDAPNAPAALVAQALAYEHGEGVPRDPLKAAAALLHRRPRRRCRGAIQPRMDVCQRSRRRARRRGCSFAVRACGGGGTRRSRKDAALRRRRSRRPARLHAPARTSAARAGARRRCRARSLRRASAVETEDRRSGGAARPAIRAGSAARPRNHQRRIELRAEGTLAERRARADAAHSRRRRIASTSAIPTTSRTICAAALRTCAGCSRITREKLRSPWRRTTRERRRSTGIEGFRLSRKRATTCSACCGSSAASGMPSIPASSRPRPSSASEVPDHGSRRDAPACRRLSIALVARDCVGRAVRDRRLHGVRRTRPPPSAESRPRSSLSALTRARVRPRSSSEARDSWSATAR